MVAVPHHLVGDVHAVGGHRVAGGRLVRKRDGYRSLAGQRRILPQDPGVQVLHVRTRQDPQFLVEQIPQLTVRAERVGLPARAVQREHPRPPQAFAQRVRRGECLKFGDEAA
jgi:hypothetical protein